MKKAAAVYQSGQILLARFLQDRRGATAIEYTLVVALLGIVVMASLTAIGEQLRDDVFGVVISALKGVIS